MTNWDDNMQIECATSFIKPIQMDVRDRLWPNKFQLIDKKNKQKILKIAVDIVANDENALNEKVSYYCYSYHIILVLRGMVRCIR